MPKTDLEALKKKLPILPANSVIEIRYLKEDDGDIDVAVLDLTPAESRVVLAAAVNAERVEKAKEGINVMKNMIGAGTAFTELDGHPAITKAIRYAEALLRELESETTKPTNAAKQQEASE